MVKFFLEPIGYKYITLYGEKYLYVIDLNYSEPITKFFKFKTKTYKKYFLFGPTVVLSTPDDKPYFSVNFNIENENFSKIRLLSELHVELDKQKKLDKRREEILKGELI